MIRHRFNFLLMMLILLLLVAPFLSELGPAARLALSFVFFGMLLSSVCAVSERRNQLIVAGILAATTIALRVASLLVDDSSAWLAFRNWSLVLEVVCFGLTVVLILRYLLSSDRVTFDMICASLCAYLLLGVIWADVYILISVRNKGAFDPSLFAGPVASTASEDAASDPEPESSGPGLRPAPEVVPHPEERPTAQLDPETLRRLVDEIFITAFYLSFVTLTTLGYGDITPVSEAARMLTIVEAIVGQFYLTVLVARLVGLHIAGWKENKTG